MTSELVSRGEDYTFRDRPSRVRARPSAGRCGIPANERRRQHENILRTATIRQKLPRLRRNLAFLLGEPGGDLKRQMEWRRVGDSNPRYRFCPYNGLANRRLQPLGQLSGDVAGWDALDYTATETAGRITCAEKRSISSACGLDCSSTSSTPTAADSCRRS